MLDLKTFMECVFVLNKKAGKLKQFRQTYLLILLRFDCNCNFKPEILCKTIIDRSQAFWDSNPIVDPIPLDLQFKRGSTCKNIYYSHSQRNMCKFETDTSLKEESMNENIFSVEFWKYLHLYSIRKLK